MVLTKTSVQVHSHIHSHTHTHRHTHTPARAHHAPSCREHPGCGPLSSDGARCTDTLTLGPWSPDTRSSPARRAAPPARSLQVRHRSLRGSGTPNPAAPSSGIWHSRSAASACSRCTGLYLPCLMILCVGVGRGGVSTITTATLGALMGPDRATSPAKVRRACAGAMQQKKKKKKLLLLVRGLDAGFEPAVNSGQSSSLWRKHQLRVETCDTCHVTWRRRAAVWTGRMYGWCYLLARWTISLLRNVLIALMFREYVCAS